MNTTTINEQLPAGFELCHVSITHKILIDSLGVAEGYRSPVKMMFDEAVKPEAERIEPDPTSEEMQEFCFILSRPASESRAAMKAGRAAFRETAMQAVGDVLSPGALENFFLTALEHYVAEFNGKNPAA